ncbi:MAG: ferredoxin-like protein [Thermodesulfobacteriota bacterium]|nr:ferredoxin-like protein [Thermodesulfobacteriota bacterium]
MFFATLTNVPIIGKLVRAIANVYGKKMHGGYILTLEEVNKLIDKAQNIALGPCRCRQVFKNCSNPVNTEILIGQNIEVFSAFSPSNPRKITHEEAKRIILDCHEKHLLHTLIRCKENYYALCNCCSCCCVPLRLMNDYGIMHSLIRKKDILMMDL